MIKIKFLSDSGLRSLLNKVNNLINKKTEGHKRCVVLTQTQYNNLSSTEKNRADTLYFIKE